MSAPELAALLADQAEDVCRYLLPNGVKRGRDWCVGSLAGEAGSSLKVCVSGSNVGRWADFAADESGDLVGLWKAVRRIDVADALREIEGWLGLAPNGMTRRELVRPVAQPAEPSHTHSRYGSPSRTWAYRDASGGILGYISRFDPDGERKQILPQTWDGSSWNWKAFPEPRPLYGLAELAARPDAPVLVVEGEKCADAAARLIPAMVVVTWPGGAKALSKVDLEPLRGRVLTLWPDADEPGIDAMETIATRLQQPCRIVRPNGFAEGWDVADADAEGWDGQKVIAWAREHVEHWFPPPAEEVPRESTAYVPVSEWKAPEHGGMLEGDPWPKSIDIFTKSAVPALHPGLLPPAVESFVLDQSEIVGSDPCILATSALTCLAVVTHDSLKLQPRRYDPQWRESARLWGAFVGDPSTKKTPALSRALSHLRKLDVDLAEKGEAAMPAYDLALKRHAKAVARAVDDLEADAPESPARPARERLIAEDTTIEKLADLLVDNSGGLLIHHDELSGFFGSFDAYTNAKGKDAAFWLQAYNGGPRRVDRVSRGSIIVPNLSVCVVGGIQPDKIRELASKLADDGLVQRFMITIASEVEGIGVDRAPDRFAIDNYRSIMDWLVRERGHPDNPVRLSDGAIDVMRDVEERLKAYRSMGSLSIRMRSHVGKWDGLFCRLCLLYHAVECAQSALPVRGEVSQDNAERVRFLMLTYLMPHLMSFYDDVLGNSGALAHVQWLAGHILAKGATEISARDIYQAYRPWRAMPQPVRDQIMSTLEVVGWIRAESLNKRQSAQRWSVNPAIPDDFAKLRDEERERRDSAKNRILRAFYES